MNVRRRLRRARSEKNWEAKKECTETKAKWSHELGKEKGWPKPPLILTEQLRLEVILQSEG